MRHMMLSSEMIIRMETPYRRFWRDRVKSEEVDVCKGRMIKLWDPNRNGVKVTCRRTGSERLCAYLWRFNRRQKSC